MKKYTYTINEEIWTEEISSDKKVVIEMGRLLASYNDVDKYFIGEVVECKIIDLTGSIDIIDDIQEAAYDDSEYGEDYLNCLNKGERGDLEKMLGEMLTTWADKHNRQPSWFSIINIESYEV